MSIESATSKHFPEYVLIRRWNNTKNGIKQLNEIIRDYKILLSAFLINGLPLAPCHLLQSEEGVDTLLLTVVSAIFIICRTLVWIFTCYYGELVLQGASLSLTFDFLNICSLISTWCLFFKRRVILDVLRSVIGCVGQINSTKFKSKWNILIVITIYFVTVVTPSATAIYVSLNGKITSNVSSVTFFWHEYENEQKDFFVRMTTFLTALTYFYSMSSCGLIAVACSTTYFHLGDILQSYGRKLKERFQFEAFGSHSINENLLMFQEIIDLNDLINNAFSSSVLFFYGATISCFINGISIVIYFNIKKITTYIMFMLAFIFALITFFGVTITGNRVRQKYIYLLECLIPCSRRVTVGDVQDRITYSIMTQDIRSVNMCVTCGDMFVIGNELMLTVAGALITYGVIIFKMDDR